MDVFNVPELAEMVILSCPVQDIVTVRRTCKQLKAVCDGNKKIRAALSLEAQSAPIRRTLQRSYTWETLTGEAYSGVPFINPAMSSMILVDDRDCDTKRDRSASRILHHGFVENVSAHPLPILRDMQFTHPPMQEVHFWCTGSMDEHEEMNGGVLAVAMQDGVTIGAIYDLLKQHLAVCPTCPKEHGMPEAQSKDRWEWMGEHEVECLSEDTTGYEILAKMRET